MNVTVQFVKNIPASESPVLEISGGVVTGGVGVILENLSQTNTLVYRVQESYDRTTWVDKQFESQDSGLVSQFSVPPLGRHHFKVTYSRPFMRIVAAGNLISNFSLSYSKPSELAATTPVTIVP